MKTKFKRCIAMLLSLSMVISIVGGFSLLDNLVMAYVQDQLDDAMHIIVRHWHANGTDTAVEGYLKSDGDFVDQNNKTIESDDFSVENTSITIPTAENEGEKISGYAVSAGHEAVKVPKEETDNLVIDFKKSIHLVKVHVFYKDISSIVHGEAFMLGSDELEADVKIKEDGNKYYNTAAGLHTDKTVTGDKRTFKVDLESWYAGNSIADVGLILDASGSMAFISDNEDLKPMKLGNPDEDGNISVEGINGEDVKLNTYQYITQEDLDNILDPDYTDNSKLGYSDYTYYIFDERDSVREFVPLGYWNGKGKTVESVNSNALPESNKLVGYWNFDKNLTNLVSDVNAILVDHPSADGSYTNEPNGQSAKFTTTSSNVANGEGALIIDRTASNDENNSNSGVLLKFDEDDDFSLGDEFTISFAVKKASNNDSSDKLASLFSIGDLTSGGYRAVRAAGGSTNRLKFGNFTTTEPNASNVNNIFSNTNYKIITYVVENNKVTTYINGKNDDSSFPITGNGDLNLINDKNIVLGGYWDQGYNGSNIYIDDLFVYNTALNKDNVQKLVKNVSNAKGDSVFSTLNPNGEVMAEMPSTELNVSSSNASTVSGWYYATSTGNWTRNFTNPKLKTGKILRALLNSEVIENKIHYSNLPSSVKKYLINEANKAGVTGDTDDEKAQNYIALGDGNGKGKKAYIYSGAGDFKGSGGYYYDFDNNSSSTFEVTENNVAITLPEDATRQGVASGTNAGYISPVVFFIDSQGYLRCFFNTGSSNKGASEIRSEASYVYMKPDSTRIKAEELQYALGSFAADLGWSSPISRLSAVRFSTNNAITDKYDDSDKLVLLDWTKSSFEASKILSVQRGDQSSIGYDISTPNLEDENTNNDVGINQYNYGLTGGTHTWTGFEAFDKHLANRISRDDTSKNAKKYLIMFTDGKDDNLKSADGKKYIDKTIEYANKFKSEGYTIFCVMLTGGANQLDSDIEKFIADIAGNTESDNKFKESGQDEENRYDYMKDKYVFVPEKIEDLPDAFQQIRYSITDALVDYTVKDYIDPRFDIYDGDKLITLNDGGKLIIDGKETTISEEGKEITIDNEYSATLYYDSENHMYYLRWDNQTIPGCTIGDNSLTVWKRSFNLQAKEDFIGGNGVLTNGNEEYMNYVYSDEDEEKSSGTSDMKKKENDSYVSKGFPRTAANVELLDLKIEDGKQKIYLGEKITPEKLLNELSGTIDSSYYWEYLKRYYTTESELKAAINKLMTEKTLEVPYSYLYNATKSNLTGTDAHRKDVLGTLTYKWAAAPSGTTTDNEYITKDTASKTYTLTVEFTPLEVGTAANPDEDTDATGRVKKNTDLVGDKDYKWNADYEYKRVAGTEQTELSKSGKHVTDIVKGEILLGMRLTKEQYEYLYEYYKGETLSYSADLKRTYGGTENETVGTLTTKVTFDTPWDKLENSKKFKLELNDQNEWELVVYSTTNWLDEDSDHLPIGTYTLVPSESNSENTLPLEFGDMTVINIQAKHSGLFDTLIESESAVDYAAPANDENSPVFYLGTETKSEGSKSYLDDRLGIAEIEGTLKPGDLKISKIVQDQVDLSTNTHGSFTFKFELYTSKDKKTAINDTFTCKDIYGSAGTIKNGDTFELKGGESLVIEGLPASAYYTITEDTPAGYKLEGQTSGTVESGKTVDVDFTNIYSASGKIKLDVSKKLAGRKWIDSDEFEFMLKSADKNTIAAIENGNIGGLEDGKWTLGNDDDNSDYYYITKKITKADSAVNMFDDITFNKPGDYKFTISEVIPTGATKTSNGKYEFNNIIYDSNKYSIWISVAEQREDEIVKKNGELDVSASYVSTSVSEADNESDGNETKANIVFTNQAITKWAPEVKKNLEGRQWTDEDSFTFEMKLMSENSDNVENSEQTLTIKKGETENSSYTKKFDDITFTEVGTYKFIVSEVNGGAVKNGITYDDTKYEITVVVSDDGNGNLIADVSGNEDVTFNNKYTKPDNSDDSDDDSGDSDDSDKPVDSDDSDDDSNVTIPNDQGVPSNPDTGSNSFGILAFAATAAIAIVAINRRKKDD